MDYSLRIADLPCIDRAYPYQTAQEKESVIAGVAQAVANLYAYFLTGEAHEETSIREFRGKSVILGKLLTQEPLPTEDRISSFKSILIDTIAKILSEKNTIRLSVDACPEKILGDVFSKAGITSQKHPVNYGCFIPYSSCTDISLSDCRVIVSVNFRAVR